jgi:hypothetical protein
MRVSSLCPADVVEDEGHELIRLSTRIASTFPGGSSAHIDNFKLEQRFGVKIEHRRHMKKAAEP